MRKWRFDAGGCFFVVGQRDVNAVKLGQSKSPEPLRTRGSPGQSILHEWQPELEAGRLAIARHGRGTT